MLVADRPQVGALAKFPLQGNFMKSRAQGRGISIQGGRCGGRLDVRGHGFQQQMHHHGHHGNAVSLTRRPTPGHASNAGSPGECAYSADTGVGMCYMLDDV